MRKIWKKITAGLLILAFLAVQTGVVKALEMEISDNGSGATSEATVEVKQETQVTQNNDAEVQNNIQTNSNTGGNEASGNTGGTTSIETGNTSTNVSIENSVNSSSVNAGACCPDEVSAEISGNGADSENEIDLKFENNTEVNVNQNANIQNNIQGTVNTGNNKANDNTVGSVSIETGDIKVNGRVINGLVNTASVQVTSGFGGNLSVAISGNGSGSDNKINAYFENPVDVYIDNQVSFQNWVDFDLNTGGNEAKDNTGGDVKITTGDIDFTFFIKNLANLSNVDIDACCELEKDEPDKPSDDKEEPKDDDKEDGEDGDGDDGGKITPTAVSTVGGPVIIGLSDTSSPEAQSVILLAGLLMIALGVKYIGESITKSKPSFAKRNSQ